MLEKYGFLMNVAFILSVFVCYFVTAISLHTISKCRALAMSWLAWIPIWQNWTLGNIADDFQKNTQGRKTCWRWVLPLLTVARDVLTVIAVLKTLGLAASGLLVIGAGYTGTTFYIQSQLQKMEVIGWIVIALFAVQRVCKAGALYSVYRSCGEKTAFSKALCSLLPVAPTVYLRILVKREMKTAA